MCCYGKMWVNVAVFTHYICNHIHQDFIITTHYYIAFYHFNN